MDTEKALPSLAVIAVSAAALYLFTRNSAARRRYKLVELFDRNAPGYEDATAQQRSAVQANLHNIEAAAQAIADAPGLLSDNDAAALRALYGIRSRYELLWLNRMFAGSRYRMLGVFDPEGPAPQVGEYMDAFLSSETWNAAVEHLENLPKY